MQVSILRVLAGVVLVPFGLVFSGIVYSLFGVVGLAFLMMLVLFVAITSMKGGN
tara:strand:+ start:296 stop:457 length:162 start_codon:yes stop_codon:yes gene_type:complete